MQRQTDFDVIVIGGALAGAATALLLRREDPQLQVLVVERSTHFTRRVGEATVEVSTYFLTRVLGLMQHLNEAHLVKNGMRFWFAGPDTATLADCAEIGGRYQARLIAFQVDRAVLDEEVLRRAVAAGTTLWRPALVEEVALEPGGTQRVTVRRGAERTTVTARWVVDASGVAAVLARSNGWLEPNPAHPTAALWARWRGVKDWDGLELAAKFPAWAQASFGIRGTATNHLTGDGWWAWLIPLKGGDVSIGVVYDQRLVQWPTDGTPGQRLKEFLCRHPAGRELLADAQWIEGDVLQRKNLAYSCSTQAGDGFVLVSDAAGFIDPLYSPGMDWVSYTTTRAVQLITAARSGEPVGPLVEQHNRDFTKCYRRWFEAIYRDKYEYLGEFDLVRRAFVLDLGLYYMGVVSQPFLRGAAVLGQPIFTTPASTPFYLFIRLYNRRFAAMGRDRRRRRALGRANTGRRHLLKGFTFAAPNVLTILWALLGWARLELTEGWRTWFKRSR